jgi:hypothetical protein
MIDKYHVKYCWKTTHCHCYELINCLWLSPPFPHNILQIHHVMLGPNCRNLSLGLTTKARGCKVAGQEKDPEVTSHAPRSAKECEGMNPHTPK